ncbi:SHOCT domain-containing protein [Roseateles sp.]|uniref:SHOCT domain-containing protein n=1 Tax=Roseateles sp. TaxID=1971397 RepID=UPI003D15110C
MKETAGKVLKRLWQYDIVKNAISGAAIGAVASLFIPFLRPVKGALLLALLFAGVGVYRNLGKQSSAINKEDGTQAVTKDVAEEIRKFAELRTSNAITEEEFQAQKKRLLGY